MVLQIVSWRTENKEYFSVFHKALARFGGNSTGYVGKPSLTQLAVSQHVEKFHWHIWDGILAVVSYHLPLNHWFWQTGSGSWADSLTILMEWHMMHFQINGALLTTPIPVFIWSIMPQDSSLRTAMMEFLAHKCDPFPMPPPSKPNPISVCQQLTQSLLTISEMTINFKTMLQVSLNILTFLLCK